MPSTYIWTIRHAEMWNCVTGPPPFLHAAIQKTGVVPEQKQYMKHYLDEAFSYISASITVKPGYKTYNQRYVAIPCRGGAGMNCNNEKAIYYAHV